MLNLTEEWKKAYAEYIAEEEKKFDDEINSTFIELMEAREEIVKGYEIIETYCQMIDDGYLGEGAPVGSSIDSKGNITYPSKEVEVQDRKETEAAEKEMYKYDAGTVMKSLMALADKSDAGKTTYQPAYTYTVQKMSDMKFMDRIVFFLGQFAKWIKNVVLYFIEKIKNLIRRLVGAPTKELNPDALKLNLTRAQKIEKVATSIDLGKGANDVAKAWRISPADFGGRINDALTEDSWISKDPVETVKKQPVIVTLDFSRDIMNLRELMQHFYDLFDNALGSNGEKLFETGDLEIILKMFKDTIDRLKSGNIASRYDISGMAVEVSAVNKDRVRDNLVLTNTNINNLKAAYVQTSNKIVDITRIMNTKEMQMLGDLGVSYEMLTASTYEQIMQILQTMPARMKQASKMETELNKMKKSYETILAQVQSMQRNVPSVGNITYDTIYNRRVLELTQAAKWMNDTITLRLAGLTLYIKEMKDVRDALAMLANMNASKKGLMDRIKDLF